MAWLAELMEYLRGKALLVSERLHGAVLAHCLGIELVLRQRLRNKPRARHHEAGLSSGASYKWLEDSSDAVLQPKRRGTGGLRRAGLGVPQLNASQFALNLVTVGCWAYISCSSRQMEAIRRSRT